MQEYAYLDRFWLGLDAYRDYRDGFQARRSSSTFSMNKGRINGNQRIIGELIVFMKNYYYEIVPR